MSDNITPGDLPNRTRSVVTLVTTGLMILAGVAFFPRVLAEYGPRSRLLILLCLVAFACSFLHIVWCLGLAPFARNSSSRTLSLVGHATGYVGALAIAGWSSATLAWGIGLVSADHLAFGIPLILTAVGALAANAFMFRRLQTALRGSSV